MASPNDVPRVSEPIAAAGGYVTRAWVDFFLKLASSQSNEDLAALYQQLAARVAELEDGQAFNFQILGQESIWVNGIPQQGGVVIISLQNDVTAPGNTSYYGTGPSGAKGWFPISGAFTVTSGDLVKTVGSDGVTNFGLANVSDSGTGTLLATTFDAKGRKTGSKAATITGTASQIVVANGDASAGLPTISLADLANSGAGTLRAYTRDAKGRISGDKAATITGTTNQINVANGDASAGLPTLSLAAPVIASLAKADSALQPAAPHNTSLSGLQGGAAGEYYHATAAQNAALAALSTSAYIDGLQLIWNSVNSVSFTSGTAAIPSLGALLRFPSAITKSGLSLAASTFYHTYGFSNSGTPDVEITTTAPSAPYLGAARTKTGDTSRRYLGSFLTDASGFIHQFIQSGNLVLYPRAGAGGGSVFRVLSAKITAAEQAVSLSGVIPSTASGVFARFFFNRSVGDNAMNFGPTSGLPKLNNVTSPGVAFFTVPITSALLLYIILNNDVTDGNGAAYIDVNGFTYER